MKRQILVIALTMTAAAVFAQAKKPATAAKAPVKSAAAPAVANPLKNNIDSVSYSIGIRMAQSLRSQGFEGISLPVLQKAMADVLANKKPIIADEVINTTIAGFQQKAVAEKASAGKKEALVYLAKNGKRPGVVTLPDGLQYEVIKTGTSDVRPLATSTVKVHYHGTLVDGTVFDSSVDRGEPITYKVSGFVRGWQEALQLMTVGSKWRLYVPSDLGYGDNGSGKIGPGAVMIFDMELLGVEN